MQTPDLLTKISTLYTKTLQENPKHQQSLTKKAPISPKLINIFQIGYANKKLFEIIPEQGKVVETLKQMNVITADNKETFENHFTFPVFDQTGNIINIYGVKNHKNYKKEISLNDKGLFNIHALKQYEEIILSHSIIETLALYECGFKNVVPFKAEKTEEFFETLKKRPIKTLIFLANKEDITLNIAKRIKKQIQEHMPKIKLIVTDISNLEDINREGLEPLIEKAKSETLGSNVSTFNSAINSNDDGFIFEHCQRRYLIRGIENKGNKLKVNIKAEKLHSADSRFYLDTIDLYLSRSRKNFIRETAMFFTEDQEFIEKDLTQIIEKAEAYIKQKTDDKGQGTETITLTAQEKQQAQTFAKDPNLIDQILKDLENTGYVGEEMNKLVCYLAMTSRKMEDPLSILIISGSGAGKSSLQDTVLALCPQEDLIKLTSLTGKALFYKKEQSLSHKVLSVEEELGAEEAGYAIRSLISSKSLTIEATVRDSLTGKIMTMTNTVKGPTSVFKTTTNPETDPETRSRFLVLSIDETKEQTKRILEYQRQIRTLEGYLKRGKKQEIITKHQNFQRILKPIKIFNPFADKLSYLEDRIQVRRDHPKYLNLIDSIAFIRQYQKPIKHIPITGQEYIEVDIQDLKIANNIAHHIMGRSLDELSMPSKRLLEVIHTMVKQISKAERTSKEDVQFTRRFIREYSLWSDYQIKTHIKQLVDLEYIIPVKGRKGKQYLYELRYDGNEACRDRFVAGLANLEALGGDLEGATKKAQLIETK